VGRISFTLSEEERALVDAYLKQKHDFGQGPYARAALARKAMWEYMRKNALTAAQRARAIVELASDDTAACAQQRKALEGILEGGL